MGAVAGLGLRGVATADLRGLERELRRGSLRFGITRAGLAALHMGELWEHVRPFSPLGAEALLGIVSAVLAERDAPHGDRVHLVWTGPEGKSGWSEPTASALSSLFDSAQREVLVAGYSFDHGAEVLADLHAAMRERGVDVELFLHLEPAPKDVDIPEHIRREVATFLMKNWPRQPAVSESLRRPAHAREGSVRQHARQVRRGRPVRGHRRLGELHAARPGAKRRGRRPLESARFAEQLVAQFHAALSDGVFVQADAIGPELRQGAHVRG